MALFGVGKSIRFGIVTIIFISFTVTATLAQSIYLGNNSGVMTYGSYSIVHNAGASTVGLSYSFKGQKELAVSYGKISENGGQISSVGISGNFLVGKQIEGGLLNIEILPGFQRSYNDANERYANIFVMGLGISRDVSSRLGLNLIPRTTISYLVSPSVGVDNYLALGMNVGLGVDLNSHFKFILSPGLMHNVDERITSGVFTGGIILTGY